MRTVYRSACRLQLLLLEFSETGILSTDSLKILKYQILLKSVQWEPKCSMRTDGRIYRHTNMAKLIDTFRNFPYKPKISLPFDDVQSSTETS